MTKEKIIEMAEECVSHKTCDNCKFGNFSDGETDCNTVLAKYVAEKENEPAPSANDTSSKNNNLQLNDTANLRICQEQLERLKIELKCITYSSDIECMKERILQVSGALEMISNIIAGDGE